MSKMIPEIHVGKWRVHFVLPGDTYGVTGRLTYTAEDAEKHGGNLPMVSFFDMSVNPAEYPGGQFVSRYYMSTLLGLDNLGLGTDLREIAERGHGFSLQGDVPAWTICGEELHAIAEGIWSAYHSITA